MTPTRARQFRSVGGRYFEDCNEAQPISRSGEIGRAGLAPYAVDPANADRLGKLSLGAIA